VLTSPLTRNSTFVDQSSRNSWCYNAYINLLLALEHASHPKTNFQHSFFHSQKVKTAGSNLLFETYDSYS